MSIIKPADVDVSAFLANVGATKPHRAIRSGEAIYTQDSPADAVFYIVSGKVKITTISLQGKEAVVALLGEREFFGEGCLAGQTVRIATATALGPCTVARLDIGPLLRALDEDAAFAAMFMTYLLARNARMEADLIDHLFNSSEKRLARLLLLLANFGKEEMPQPILSKISQETLADMIGTTRSRVSHFMNKFRRLGFISYNGHIEVHHSLLSVVLKDDLNTLIVRPGEKTDPPAV